MTPLKLNEDEMADIKRDAIECLRPYLCEKLLAERHFDYLRSKMILNKDDAEEITTYPTSRRRAGELLDRLAKNPKGLDALIESIRLQKTQDFLIEKITDQVLQLKIKRMEIYKDCSLDTSLTSSNGLTSDLYNQPFSDKRLSSPETESTALYHPEGEFSLPLYFNRSLTVTSPSSIENRTRSGRLPRPGEMGAPALPIIPTLMPEEVCASSPTDSQILPLRSKSPSNST